MTQLAGIQLNSPVLLAPMAGYTDSPFRRIALEYGAGMVFTELISADGIVRRNRKTLDMLKFHEEERPVGIQVFGSDPAVMADAAGYVESLSPDCIDINMGCSAPKVCNNGKGAGLLRDPELVYRMAGAVAGAVKLPVSAKIRLGWDVNSMNYTEVVRALVEGGIAFITVHGRTKTQKYGGTADWERIGEIAENSPVPVIGNGDLTGYNEAVHRLETTPCAAVMIGRAAQGNPWVFSSRQPDMDEKLAVIRRHYRMMLEEHGDYGIVLMRKHVVKYIHGVRNATKVRTGLIRAETMEEVDSLLGSL